jgi:hypothetical protein
VFVERGSTELRNPLFKEQKYKEMFMVLLQAAPMLGQMGVPINIKRIMEMWLEAAGVDDIDGIFEQQMAQDPQMAALLAQYGGGAQGGGGPAGLGGPNSQEPGVPNTFGVGPPGEAITSSNSGILPTTEG